MITKILGLVVALYSVVSLTLRADIMIENFNSQRLYPPCCDGIETNQFGAYLAFESNLTQNGSSGTLRIDGTASDNGGLYHEGGSQVLWNLTAQTNLLLKAKRLAGNSASNCWIVLRDTLGRGVAYGFSLNSFSTNSFTTISKSLAAPDWIDDAGCDLAFITAMDVHGGMTDDDFSFRLEIDEIKAIGPNVSVGPAIVWSFQTNTLILRWNSQTGTVLNLQSSVSLPATWHNETNVQTTGTSSISLQPITGTNKFFRLAGSSGQSFTFGFKQALGALSGSDSGSENFGSLLLSPYSKSLTLPTNSVFTNDFIDVSSYSTKFEAYNFRALSGSETIDREELWLTQRDDHNGGTIVHTNTYYQSHTSGSSFPFWQRTTECVTKYIYTTTYTPSDSNWPGGWSITTSSGCHPGTNTSNYAAGGALPRLHVTDLIETSAGGGQ